MKFVNYGERAILLILVITLSWLSVEAQSNLPAKDVEAIKGLEETFRTAWLKNDEKTILALFTGDATLYPGGNAPVRGKDELYKYWFAPSDTRTTINVFDVKIEDVSGDRNFATVTGSNVIEWQTEKKDKAGLKRFVSKGYFIAVYVKQGREWRMLKRFAASKTEEIK